MTAQIIEFAPRRSRARFAAPKSPKKPVPEWVTRSIEMLEEILMDDAVHRQNGTHPPGYADHAEFERATAERRAALADLRSGRREEAWRAEREAEIARCERMICWDEKTLAKVERHIARGTLLRGPRKGLPYSERNLKDLDRWRLGVLDHLAWWRERLADLLAEVKAET